MKLTLLVAAASLAGAALIGCAAMAGSPPPLAGPCADRQAPERTYSLLALDLVFPKLKPLNVGAHLASPEAVARMLAEAERLRVSWLPELPDACLRAHAEGWLGYYERKARGWMEEKSRLNGYSNQYEKERAEEEDQKRALAARLGISR